MLAVLVLFLMAGLMGLVLTWSPGKPLPFTDPRGLPLPGSLSEKIRININGVEQGMFITSKNAANPVLLYLHGGMPDFFLTQKHPTGMEDLFTVVWWEQRGTGLSFSPDIPAGTITQEQLIADTLEVTNYLRRRFGKDKIYLMGHSGGTFIGIRAASQAPELYHAYVGVAQMVNQLQSERLAYEYMLKRFKENGNTEMVRKLEAAPVTMTEGTPNAYLALRDEGMHALGIGTMHDMKSVMKDIFLASWQSPFYTVGEKFKLWRGKFSAGVSVLWRDMLNTDLSKAVPELTIPVYFLHGKLDYTCSYTVSKAYLESLKAPVKGFYTFDNAAHSPMFEEPARTIQILRDDVLAATNRLADSR